MKAIDTPPPEVAVAPAVSAPPTRWINKTWRGPPIINAGPQIQLCSNGRYRRTLPFEAGPNASGVSVNTMGMGCCRESESGTYELERAPSGAITAVRFTPGTTASYVSPITEGDHLEGYRADPSSRPCE